MHFKAEIEWTQRSTGRVWSRECGYTLGWWNRVILRAALGGPVRASVDMHFYSKMYLLRDTPGGHNRISLRFNWRLWYRKVGGYVRASFQKTLEVMMMQACRPSSSEFRDAHGGHDHANLETITLEFRRCTSWPSLYNPGGHDHAMLEM